LSVYAFVQVSEVRPGLWASAAALRAAAAGPFAGCASEVSHIIRARGG
jgi:hypothetical protein